MTEATAAPATNWHEATTLQGDSTELITLHTAAEWITAQRVASERRHVRVAVVGDADAASAQQLRSALFQLLSARPDSVDVNLADLRFCDVRGVAALDDACAVAAATGVAMTLSELSPQLLWLRSLLESVRPVVPRFRVP